MPAQSQNAPKHTKPIALPIQQDYRTATCSLQWCKGMRYGRPETDQSEMANPGTEKMQPLGPNRETLHTQNPTMYDKFRLLSEFSVSLYQILKCTYPLSVQTGKVSASSATNQSWGTGGGPHDRYKAVRAVAGTLGKGNIIFRFYYPESSERGKKGIASRNSNNQTGEEQKTHIFDSFPPQ